MENIPLNKIYQHKINFLIGSGASSGLFPTLWLNLMDSDDPEQTETIETLATKLESSGYKHHHTLLFMYYFKKIIEPVCSFKLEYIDVPHPPPCSGADSCEKCKIIKNRKDVIANYELFLDTLVRILQYKNDFTKRCNVFTTNYDGCIPFVADKLLKKVLWHLPLMMEQTDFLIELYQLGTLIHTSVIQAFLVSILRTFLS